MKLKNLIAATLLIASSQLASADIFGQPDSIGAGQGGIIGGIIGDVGEGGAVKYVSQFQATYFNNKCIGSWFPT
ncbi:MAG: hypothetical protein PUD91_00815 [Bacteroidales bacterium]|nr:hypothetical protein [Bacteroidales bacterium]